MESIEGKERQGAENHTLTMANFQKHGLPVSLFSKTALPLPFLSLTCPSRVSLSLSNLYFL